VTKQLLLHRIDADRLNQGIGGPFDEQGTMESLSCEAALGLLTLLDGSVRYADV
jgi:hypothetical protein